MISYKTIIRRYAELSEENKSKVIDIMADKLLDLKFDLMKIILKLQREEGR